MNNTDWALVGIAAADLAGFIPVWAELALCLGALMIFSIVWTRAGGR